MLRSVTGRVARMVRRILGLQRLQNSFGREQRANKLGSRSQSMSQNGPQKGPQKGLRAEKGQTKEQAFLEEFNLQIAEGNPERALETLIAFLPRLGKGKMNRKEKLKHLTFAGRRLQSQGLGKYGPLNLQAKVADVRSTAERFGLPDRGTFLDFGCGAHEPLALATTFLANGFDCAVGNDFLPIRSPEYAAISMYDVVTYQKSFPEEFLSLGQSREAFLHRLERIDLKKLYGGDFDGGMAPIGDGVQFVCADIRDAEIPRESVSCVVSFDVFEHVMDIGPVCDCLFEITAKGGLHRHRIDLADHRVYRHDGAFTKFDFLTEEVAAPNLNRLRASEMIAAFENAGFEVLEDLRDQEPMPPEIVARLLPRWQDMSPDDQTTTGMVLTLRKP